MTTSVSRSVHWLLFALLMFVGNANYSTAQKATPSADASPDIHFSMAPSDRTFGGYFEDVVMVPGETRTLEVSIINMSDTSIALTAFGTNAHSGINGGFVPGERDEELFAPALWMDFPNFESEFESQSQKNVQFTISVPEDASPGQYISALVVQTVDALPLPGSDVFDHRLQYAITVGIVVPGEVNHAFEIGEPFWDRGYLAVPVLNQGNYLVKPIGELKMINQDGDVIITSQVEMGSIYAGRESAIYVDLPEQLPFQAYEVTLHLMDPGSGVKAELESADFVIEEEEEPTGVLISDYTIKPNADQLVFLDISVHFDNLGAQLPASNVVLEVSLNGEIVDEFPLATNQVLLRGDNTFGARYIPPHMWESGTYTFRLVVYAVDPNGGQQIELLNEDLDAEIVVP